jgi:ribosomal protein L30E
MARGAGKLAIGFDATEEALKKNKAKIVVTTDDIAARTLRNTAFAAKDVPILNLPFGQEEIEKVFRRKFVVAAVTDEHFRDLLLKAAEGFEEAGGSRQEEADI